MKRIFITGGTGFFGKSMLDYRLRHSEWEWAKAEWVILSRSPERFLSSYPTLAVQPGISFWRGDVMDFPFPEGRFDAVLHMASPIQGVLGDAETERLIISGAKRLSKFTYSAGVRNVLLTSSGAVYGKVNGCVSEDDGLMPVTGYGRAKQWVERFLVDEGLEVKTARCFAFVGRYLERSAHFAIGNFIQNCLDGRPIVINGDGTPLRSYLYADDLVEWLFAILERGESGRPYNVGSDRAISIRELAETVRSVLGAKKSEIIVKGKPEPGAEPSAYVPSIARAREELGLGVKTALENAIRLSV